MSVSIVNGYLCYSACDAAKARAGKDPHPQPDANEQGASVAMGSPAVIFGGTLAGRNAVIQADAAPAARDNLAARAARVDILV
jgi:hypothetical protein